MTFLSRLAEILTEICPTTKASMAQEFVAEWRQGTTNPEIRPLENWPSPATRSRPVLAPPGSMKRRGLGSIHGRIALVHALCHIEINAIDLAADMIGRFVGEISSDNQPAFIGDWLLVMDDEARHFTILSERLVALGAAYGDLPAHDGLWQAAARTQNDVLARLAIAPMVLEARGLDVTPAMAARLTTAGDQESAAILNLIYQDEIGHVEIGTRWFRAFCQSYGLNPENTFAAMVAKFFPNGLKPPFNHDGREQSNFPRSWYEGLTEDDILLKV